MGKDEILCICGGLGSVIEKDEFLCNCGGLGSVIEKKQWVGRWMMAAGLSCGSSLLIISILSVKEEGDLKF